MVSLSNEIRRKGIHLIGLIVPLLYWTAGKFVTLCFIAFWTILFIAGEVYRFRRGIPKEIEEVAPPMMRKHERMGVGGHVSALGLFHSRIFVRKEYRDCHLSDNGPSRWRSRDRREKFWEKAFDWQEDARRNSGAHLRGVRRVGLVRGLGCGFDRSGDSWVS